MRQQPARPWGAILAGHRLDGYRCGHAPGADRAEIAADRAAVEAVQCECGGLWEYHPFYNPATGSHVAFAVCQQCGLAVQV